MRPVALHPAVGSEREAFEMDAKVLDLQDRTHDRTRPKQTEHCERVSVRTQ
jgi:hypothetical protein